MGKKEWIICTWIHHIATVIGLYKGCRRLFMERLRGIRGLLMFLFLASQIWAGVKILRELTMGESRLKQSFENIHRVSKNEDEERGILFTIAGFSALFKIGVPWFLGK